MSETRPVASESDIAGALLHWYDRHARRLPWRASADAPPDAYAVWLSEIMLQQTTVAAVKPYFLAFTARWPRLADLAAAPREEVLRMWAGLGYYARARNLHACAVAVVENHGGRFPESEKELRRLPGIGDYTAAAIAAIAFGQPAVVVDGNVERVVARFYGVSIPLPTAKRELKRRAAGLTPVDRPGDYAQAMMDLGATICTPRRPACALCPLQDPCRARRLGLAESLPARLPKATKPTRRGVAFWLEDGAGSVLLRTRSDAGLLGGMTEIPSTAWREGPAPALDEAMAEAPLPASWRAAPDPVRHSFTHFHLELSVAKGRIAPQPAPAGCRWVPLDQLDREALPSVMAKVATHALAARGG